MESTTLTYFDYIVLFIVFYSTFIAFFKGFIKTSTSLLSWAFQFVGTFYLYTFVTPIVKNFVSNPVAVYVVTGFVSYFTCLTIISVINGKIIDITVNIRGGAIDRSLGLAFGFLRGCLISCLIFKLITVTYPIFTSPTEEEVAAQQQPLPVAVKKAETYNLLHNGSKLIMSVLPDNVAAKKLDLTSKDKDSSIGSSLSKILNGFKNSTSNSSSQPQNNNNKNSATDAKTESIIDNLKNYQKQLDDTSGKKSELPELNLDNLKNLNKLMNEIQELKKQLN
jgi:uncharacterized membrane protein required for colicin V production